VDLRGSVHGDDKSEPHSGTISQPDGHVFRQTPFPQGVLMSRPLAVGVVGAGGIADPHTAAWRALGADIVIYSADGGPALAERYGGTVVYSLAELLDSCEIVDVCTPTFVHDEIVLAAAKAGRHVVCEKPLARSHRQAAAMIDACESAGKQIYPGQVVRFFPEYVAAKQAVEAGRIGDPAVLRFSRRGAAPRMPWFTDTGASGGILVDQMIHDLDFARWIAGDVTRVFAQVTGGGSEPTTAYAVLTHESGALSHVTGGWGHEKMVFRTSFSLTGSTGLIEHDSLDTPPLNWDLAQSANEGGTLLPSMDFVESPFLTELREFAAAFNGGPTPRVTAADGLAALDIGLAALESARTGRAVAPKEIAGE
jgi:myo-inositol 2-dehydrogenase/D-chiro-inositol 1-dehydrogenase